jgi:septal ring-binding cell division protein DamX
MAKKRNRESREPKRGALDERRRLIAAGSLSTAVVIVLVVGAVLRTDAPFAETTVPVSEPTTTTRVVDAPLPEPPEATPSPEPRMAREAVATPDRHASRTPRPAGSLAARASADLDRMLDSGGSYTLQLMVSCDLDNARNKLDLAGNNPRLYVLPMELDGKDCYRLCWGSYSTRENAEKVDDLPASLASALDDPPRVRAVAELAS